MNYALKSNDLEVIKFVLSIDDIKLNDNYLMQLYHQNLILLFIY